ncbi:MAG: response regulator [Planctomycetales bacterium]|nr:response regulator [Planctomycetales bacterium]
MRIARRLSIRSKLILLSTVSAAGAIMMMCFGFWANYSETLYQNQIRVLTSQAQFLAFNATGVMSFEDASAGSELLNALESQEEIEYACLYRTDGRLLAEYKKPMAPAYLPPNRTPPVGHRTTRSGQLEVVLPIRDDAEALGLVLLRANTEAQQHQMAYFARLTAGVTVGSLIVAALLAAGLQRKISGPLATLADAARDITEHEDYAQRVAYDGKDEIGSLYSALNALLERVQTSQAALNRAHDELEDRVTERTARLCEEMTHREVIQKDLERSKEAAEAANRAKSEFLANMSHEIRTPLNGILGFTNLLRAGADDGDEEERRDYLDTIHSSGEHLLELINGVLDLSKIEAGQLDLEQLDCPIQSLFSPVMSMLRVKAIEKDLELNCCWETDVPESICTDPARFRQLLMNLVGNAIKFTNEGSVDIVVQLQRSQGQYQLEVDVADSGIGIPLEKIDQVFRPFVQADSSVTRNFGGTGLGLPISRKIARALGGDLTVKSEPGVGSTFRFFVPLGDLKGVELIRPSDADALVEKENTGWDSQVKLEGLRVLLVEDGAVNRKLIRLMLTRQGVVVEQAENGKVGLEKGSSAKFDLILMDMQMPVMDGYTAATRLRDRGVQTPIVALTAHAMKGDEDKCLAAGCTGYLTKPVDAARLFGVLAKVAPTTNVADVATESSSQRPTAKRDRVPTAVSAPPALLSVDTSPLPCSLPLDDPDFLEIVEEFVVTLEARFAEIESCLAAGQFDELSRHAHWLKGTSGTAGFADLVGPSAQLEQYAKAGEPKACEESLHEIRALAARIVLPSSAR